MSDGPSPTDNLSVDRPSGGRSRPLTRGDPDNPERPAIVVRLTKNISSSRSLFTLYLRVSTYFD